MSDKSWEVYLDRTVLTPGITSSMGIPVDDIRGHASAQCMPDGRISPTGIPMDHVILEWVPQKLLQQRELERHEIGPTPFLHKKQDFGSRTTVRNDLTVRRMIFLGKRHKHARSAVVCQSRCPDKDMQHGDDARTKDEKCDDNHDCSRERPLRRDS